MPELLHQQIPQELVFLISIVFMNCKLKKRPRETLLRWKWPRADLVNHNSWLSKYFLCGLPQATKLPYMLVLLCSGEPWNALNLMICGGL